MHAQEAQSKIEKTFPADVAWCSKVASKASRESSPYSTKSFNHLVGKNEFIYVEKRSKKHDI